MNVIHIPNILMFGLIGCQSYEVETL